MDMMVNVSAPVPARIMKIYVRTGQKIHKGELLAMIETEDFTSDIVSTDSGVIENILVNEGEDVDNDAILLEYMIMQ